ncbi:MAG TPA: GxxExxY protein [Humisphaera sp.]
MSLEEAIVGDCEEPDPELNRITHGIIGAAIEVHRHLGPGHLESAYEEAMAIEMGLRGIAFARQVDVDLTYKGQVIGTGRLDFLVEGLVVVDLKAIKSVGDVQAAQMISYLAITGHPLGLIINFNVATLRNGIRRIAGRSRVGR